MTDADTLRALADDELRVASARLAHQLRRLAEAALDAAAGLADDPLQRADLTLVDSRALSVRTARAVLAATRSGVYRLHQEAARQPRSGGAGSGRA